MPDVVKTRHSIFSTGYCSIVGLLSTRSSACGLFQKLIGLNPAACRVLTQADEVVCCLTHQHITCLQKGIGLSSDSESSGGAGAQLVLVGCRSQKRNFLYDRFEHQTQFIARYQDVRALMLRTWGIIRIALTSVASSFKSKAISLTA